MNRPKRQKQTRRYKNASGNSDVTHYEIAKDGLTIRFKDHSVYRYTNQSASPENISKMKELAIAGKGLGTFITTNLKDKFLCKVR